MALDRVIADCSWTCFGLTNHSNALAFCDGNPSSFTTVACPRLRSTTGLSKTVAAARAKGQAGHDAGKSSAVSKRVFHSQNESHRIFESSDRLGLDPEAGSCSSLSGLASAGGQGKAAVLDQSRDLRKSTAIPTGDAATLRLLSKRPTTDIGGENSALVTGVPASRSNSLRVAVDVDEVLGSFLSSLNMFIAERYCLNYKQSEYQVYDFMKIWRCSQAEANDRVHAFFESEHFKDGILPVPGAYESLLRLAEFCHLVVVTSRQHVIKKQTLDWIECHYAGIFSDVYFGNHFALEGEPRPKSEICRSIGAQILIDDNPRYAVECAEHGIEVLLFDQDNSYPWSKTSDGPEHPLIARVQSWQEIEQMLFARFRL